MANGAADAPALRDIDASVPHSARIWNYWLGGKDNFAGRPGGRRRVPRRLSRAAGQGPGGAPLPGARRAVPGRRGRACGSSSTSGPACRRRTTPTRWPSGWRRSRGSSTSTTTRWCSRTPASCSPARPRVSPTTSTPTCTTPRTSSPRPAKTLDLDQPVALLLIGVLGHVADTDEARGIVARLMDGLAPGSFLVQCDGTDTNPDYVAALERYRDSGGVPYNVRGARADREPLRGARPGRAGHRADHPVAARAERLRRRDGGRRAGWGRPQGLNGQGGPMPARDGDQNAAQSGQGAPSGSTIAAAVTTCPHTAT